MGAGGIVTLFFTSAVGAGEWSASSPTRFTPWGKGPQYLLNRRLGGPHRQSGSCGKEKNLALAGK